VIIVQSFADSALSVSGYSYQPNSAPHFRSGLTISRPCTLKCVHYSTSIQVALALCNTA